MPATATRPITRKSERRKADHDDAVNERYDSHGLCSAPLRLREFFRRGPMTHPPMTIAHVTAERGYSGGERQVACALADTAACSYVHPTAKAKFGPAHLESAVCRSVHAVYGRTATSKR